MVCEIFCHNLKKLLDLFVATYPLWDLGDHKGVHVFLYTEKHRTHNNKTYVYLILP